MIFPNREKDFDFNKIRSLPIRSGSALAPATPGSGILIPGNAIALLPRAFQAILIKSKAVLADGLRVW
jgi:hypothetical protein